MAKTRREKYSKWLDSEGWRHDSNSSEHGMWVFMGVMGGAAACLAFSIFTLIFGDIVTPGWSSVKDTDIMAPWYEPGLTVICTLAFLVMLIGEPVQAWIENLRRLTVGLSQDQLDAVHTWKSLPSNEKKKLRSSLLDFLELDNRHNAVFRKHYDTWNDLKYSILERDRVLAESNALTAGDEVKQLAESVKHETNQLRKEAQP